MQPLSVNWIQSLQPDWKYHYLPNSVNILSDYILRQLRYEWISLGNCPSLQDRFICRFKASWELRWTVASYEPAVSLGFLVLELCTQLQHQLTNSDKHTHMCTHNTSGRHAGYSVLFPFHHRCGVDDNDDGLQYTQLFKWIFRFPVF